MSMSLRDQLLQAGLVSQKQVKDAERQQERQARQASTQKRPLSAGREPARPAQGPKAARDQALNRQQQEKARKKAQRAEIKQLIEQNRLPQIESGDFYNFVDGKKVRHIAVNAAVRGGLIRGEIVIVRLEGRYCLVTAATAARIGERDGGAIVASVPQAGAPADAAYTEFPVPDDLIW